MTIREYISSKLPAFALTDADFADTGLQDVDAEYEKSVNGDEVGKGMIALIEDLVFRPQRKSVNENGFSINWEYDLGKYYMLLCKRYGVTANADVASMLGISSIRVLDAADFL